MTDSPQNSSPRLSTESFGVEVKEGDILAGKYRVDRVLGAGGMGVVVQATHEVLNDRVALKFLLPEVLRNENIVSRFLREAKAAVQIKNRHVARVVDVGKMETGSPYMVMEFLEGQDLGAALGDGEQLKLDRAVRLLLQTCEALASAHAAGIIHRDIKPANLFLTHDADGTEMIKVLDFGISKLQGETTALTRTSAAIGSPLYMSPEQMRNARGVDQRADIWSLGVVAFEMLTGQLPYMAESMTELVAVVLEKEAPPVRSLRPDLSLAVEAAVAKSLKKDPAERFQTVEEFAQALAQCVRTPWAAESAERVRRILAGSRDAAVTSGVGGSGVATLRDGVPTSTAFGQTAPDLSTHTAASRGSHTRVGLVVAAAAAVALGIGVMALRGGAEDRSGTDVDAAAEHAAPESTAATDATTAATEAAPAAPPVQPVVSGVAPSTELQAPSATPAAGGAAGTAQPHASAPAGGAGKTGSSAQVAPVSPPRPKINKAPVHKAPVKKPPASPSVDVFDERK